MTSPGEVEYVAIFLAAAISAAPRLHGRGLNKSAKVETAVASQAKDLPPAMGYSKPVWPLQVPIGAREAHRLHGNWKPDDLFWQGGVCGTHSGCGYHIIQGTVPRSTARASLHSMACIPLPSTNAPHLQA
jgi:hypothetical protein